MTPTVDRTDCQECSEERFAVHPIFELCKAKRFDEALHLCKDDIAQKPDDPASYRHMADVLELAQRPKEALPFRDKVLELAPNSAASYFSRGDLFYQTGNYPGAIQDFSKAAELDSHGALSPLAHLYRADCHRRLKAYDEAITDCQRVPDNFNFPGFLGERAGGKQHLLAAIARERGLRATTR
ncbi:MAG TPA: tetratricopeptide repeat protein [Stellaceae bacterium]|nr:tetratricopeptide repeat protein [Stellaceae bacterium]